MKLSDLTLIILLGLGSTSATHSPTKAPLKERSITSVTHSPTKFPIKERSITRATHSPTKSAIKERSITSVTHSPTNAKFKERSITRATHSPTKYITSKPVTTTVPSESPAPSPQPSGEPSLAPSATYTPTRASSGAPTESPAPSPAPSLSPSKSPSKSPTNEPSVSPSNEPSRSPSFSPTDNPSKSPSNSISPTTSPSTSIDPSSRPSRSPSVNPSSIPSSNPSDSPSKSQSPSSTPTTGTPSTTPSTGAPSSTPSSIPSESPTVHSKVASAVIGVTLDLHDALDPDAASIFEDETIQFIESQWATDMPLPEGMTIDILALKISEQTVIPDRRELVGQRNLHTAGLRIRFNITGEIMPGNLPEGFVFADQVSRPFRENYGTFIFRLSAKDAIFGNLVDGAETDSESADNEPYVAAQPNSGAIAGIVIASIGSVALAIAAGLFAIKSRRNDDGIGRKPILDFFQIEECDSHSTAMTPRNVPEQLNPNGTPTQYREHPKSLLDNAIGRNDSDGDIEDSGSDLGLKLSEDVLGAHALTKDVEGISRVSMGSRGSRASDPPEVSMDPLGARPNVTTARVGSLCYSDDDSESSVGTPHSVQLTPGVTDTPSSVFSGMANLGARPMESMEQLHFQHETASVGSSTVNAPSVRRTGLYDVFAPSGPLGIVVDTTRDGPVVHSMKPSSPLLGLISPGDLIVGLDDMDTRSMTAATLTRFMAKRSHQAERKITLLAFEGGSTGHSGMRLME